MKLDNYKCPNWNSEEWIFSFNFVGMHQGMVNQIGYVMFHLGDKYPHNVIFKLC